MWASDLEDLFSELTNCTGIDLVANYVKFESVGEFVEFIKGRNPTSNLLASGLFHKIDSILSRCERKPKFFYQYA
ncbi:hypothetical protein BZJ18_16710 [Salinivibrio sp. IB872]|nr:hypothetical protein BZJ18_16710 [Salinivibrio sp. IB872]